MKYTQKQLEAMSDFELSAEILNKHNPGSMWSNPFHAIYGIGGAAIEPIDGSDRSALYFDVNKWADMGPLIDGAINMIVSSDGTIAFSEHDKPLQSEHKNPLRAAAIVYILIKQAE